MKDRHKGFNIAMIFLVVVIIIGAILGYKVLNDNKVDEPTTETIKKLTVECYFADTASASLKAENREVQGEAITDIISNTLAELKKGPKAEGHVQTIPEGVEFLSANLDGDVLTVDVSKSYNDIKSGEEVLCRAAVVWTLTSIEGVKYVVITVEGKELTLTNGQPIGKLSREDILIDEVISPESTQYATVKLYFTNDQATGLDVEERRIEVNPNQPIERYVVEQLIAGPESENLLPTMPVETKIRDIKTTTDGICYVDLSSEFVTKHGGGSSGELLTIYSVVNSLTSLDNVKKVQFLIEGEKQEEFKGHVDFSQPFEFSDIDV